MFELVLGSLFPFLINSLIIPARSPLFQGILDNRIKDIAANTIGNGGPDGNNYIKMSPPPPNYRTIFSQGQNVQFSLCKLSDLLLIIIPSPQLLYSSIE